MADWVEVLQVEGLGVVAFQCRFFTGIAVIFSSSAFIPSKKQSVWSAYYAPGGGIWHLFSGKCHVV